MLNQELYEALATFVKNGLEILIKVIQEKKYLSHEYGYPMLKHKENGLPDITKTNFSAKDGPIDVFTLFRGFEKNPPDIDIEKIIGYREAFDFLNDNHEFQEVRDSMFFTLKEFIKTSMDITLIHFISRYYFIFEKESFSNEKFIEIYLPFENFIYHQKLVFDIAVPILFTIFDFDEFQIDGNIIIRRISDKHQQARSKITRNSLPISDPLLISATHELVLKNYQIKKRTNINEYFRMFENPSLYPMEIINNLFNSLKLQNGFTTGNAQILIYPKDWAYHFYCDLPDIYGTTIRNFPEEFEYFYWSKKDYPVISKDVFTLIADIYRSILNIEGNKINIALNRLRTSCLRNSDDDSILDIIIALEALLLDEESNELTHKLALRTTAILSKINYPALPKDIFSNVNKIYKYRSKLVHGSTSKKIKNELVIPGKKEPVKVIDLANEYLVEVLKFLIHNPQFLKVEEIDNIIFDKLQIVKDE